VERDIESGDMTVPERQNLRPSFARNRRVAQRRDAERPKKYYSFLGGPNQKAKAGPNKNMEINQPMQSTYQGAMKIQSSCSPEHVSRF